jgi:hypothetical protein
MIADYGIGQPKPSAKPKKSKPAEEIYEAEDGAIIISPALQKDMDAAANEIRKLQGKTIQNTVAIGVHLSNMKGRLKHGEFTKWWQREFPSAYAVDIARAMKAARAWTAIRKLEPEAKIDLLPPTLLYDFSNLSDDQRQEIAEAAKAGTKLKAGDFKKAATSKKTSAPAATSTDKGQDKAEELAKLIADALPRDIAMKLSNHPGFTVPMFGELLRKEIAGSFGAASSGGAA